MLPLLVHHLGSDNYVTYTYAAITIDRILFIKQGNQLLFAQADIHDHASGMIDAVLKKIEAGGTPEKVAENQHLMRCTWHSLGIVSFILDLHVVHRHHAHHPHRPPVTHPAL